MQLSREIKKDIKADLKVAKKMRLPWWGVLCLIIASVLIGLPFALLGKFGLARPTLCSLGMLGVVAAIKWNARRHLWFWVTMAVIVSLHALVILSVPWTTQWVPAAVSAVVGVADLYVVLTIIDAVEVLLERRENRRRNSLQRT